MGLDGGTQTYIRDLEEHLMRAVFDGVSPNRSGAAVLLVRGALAGGDRSRAASLVQATQGLADEKRDNSDMAAAAEHARGLVDRDSATSGARGQRVLLANGSGQCDRGCRAGLVRAGRSRLRGGQRREAYDQYEQLGCAEGMSRVRSQLRACGVGAPLEAS